MRITSQTTDDAVLAELGSRLARTRLERDWSQEELAREAGVGRATVERIEAGHGATLANTIRVLRTLGLLDALDRLVPEPLPSPIERLKLRGRQRRRASGARTSRRPDSQPGATPWSWGDESEGGSS